MLKHVDGNNFTKEVLENKKVILVDFFAAWCGPCNMLVPILENISKTTDEFDIAKINIDECQELASKYGVEVIPTLFVFKNGEPVNKTVGLLSEDQIIELVKKFI